MSEERKEVHICPLLRRTVIWEDGKCSRECEEKDCPIRIVCLQPDESQSKSEQKDDTLDIDFKSISFRHISECLKEYIGDAPVYFTPIDELDKTNYIFCRFMGIEEANAIRNGRHNAEAEYENSDVGIYLPDITIDQFYCLEEQRNPVAQGIILSRLNAVRKMYIKERQLWFALFCFLHEIGHWKYFIQSGLSASDYEESEHDIRDKFERIGDKIRNIPENIFYTVKIRCAEQYHKDSHEQIPSEKAADEYALQNFDLALTSIRKALGYDEKWLAIHWQP